MTRAHPVVPASAHLADASRWLARILAWNTIYTPPKFAVSEITCQMVKVPMRDGALLATDVYLPPKIPAPTVAMRTPYGRGGDETAKVLLAFARRGYAVVAQDCRGTGDSEPDVWDYYMYEPEDGYDLVEWIGGQSWFNGFLGSFGASYVGQTQWQMAMHPAMSAIVPEVSGLGVAVNTAHIYMFLDAYARSVGKGDGRTPTHMTEMERAMADETLAGGYFNDPLYLPLPEALLARYPDLNDLPPDRARGRLWDHYCDLDSAGRAGFVQLATGSTSVSAAHVEGLTAVFGHRISHDRHTLPHPRMAELCGRFHAPTLMRTGWYDWGLNDALATWDLLMRAAPEPMRSRSRLFIGPNAHNWTGYHEGMDAHPELCHPYGTGTATNFELLLHWYDAVQNGRTDDWPTVVYYLMGANEWRAADAWPPASARTIPFYLADRGRLTERPPDAPAEPDTYTYDPNDPTPTIGGSIVSYAYPPGSVDVARVQRRPDVLTYTTDPLPAELDVVGPLELTLYASSTAVDTDFVARLTDVFPDGRSIQLQNGILRARYRNGDGEPELVEPGRIYRFRIDLWATANRFRAGHRLRIDIASADFPRFDRNANRGGRPGSPVPARQTIYHDIGRPSHLLVSVLD